MTDLLLPFKPIVALACAWASGVFWLPRYFRPYSYVMAGLAASTMVSIFNDLTSGLVWVDLLYVVMVAVCLVSLFSARRKVERGRDQFWIGLLQFFAEHQNLDEEQEDPD